MNIHLIAAARPNFMKMAPLYHALKRESWCTPRIIRTGQHKDYLMSETFFQDLWISASSDLGVSGGTHAQQTGRTMTAYEDLCDRARPDVIIVSGDVNATMACALVGAKLRIPVVHLEAGLRSFDRSMPEEINRIVTDSISDLLWTPSEDATANLYSEGIPPGKVLRIGNIMIDALEMLRPRIEREAARHTNSGSRPYAVATFHRPSNVDDRQKLEEILAGLGEAARKMRILFPVHPRTRKRLDEFGLSIPPGVEAMRPLGYVEFMALVWRAAGVITDSGGVQEETTYLGVPCCTVRDNTERPITVSHGTNRLIAPSQIAHAVGESVLRLNRPRIPLWDGHTAERAVRSLRSFLNVQPGGVKS